MILNIPPGQLIGYVLGGLILLVFTGLFAVLRGTILPKHIVDRLLRGKDEVIEKQELTIQQLLSVQQPLTKLLEILNEQAEAKVESDDGTTV